MLFVRIDGKENQRSIPSRNSHCHVNLWLRGQIRRVCTMAADGEVVSS